MEDTWASNRDNGPLEFHVQENILDLSERVYTIELSVMSCFTYLERFFKWFGKSVQSLQQMLGKAGQKKLLSFKPHPLTWLTGHRAIITVTDSVPGPATALGMEMVYQPCLTNPARTVPSTKGHSICSFENTPEICLLSNSDFKSHFLRLKYLQIF